MPASGPAKPDSSPGALPIKLWQFSVQEIPPLGWERFGPLGGFAPRLLGSLVRLLWLALNPQNGFSRLPHGWAHSRFALPVTLACGARETEIQRALQSLCWGDPAECSAWLLACAEPNLPPFEQAARQSDMEEIESFIASYRDGKTTSPQLALL